MWTCDQVGAQDFSKVWTIYEEGNNFCNFSNFWERGMVGKNLTKVLENRFDFHAEIIFIFWRHVVIRSSKRTQIKVRMMCVGRTLSILSKFKRYVISWQTSFWNASFLRANSI